MTVKSFSRGAFGRAFSRAFSRGGGGGIAGLTAAWSLRTVVPGYAGPLVRLFKDGDPSTAEDFYADQSGHLDVASVLAWQAAESAWRCWPERVYEQTGNGAPDITFTAQPINQYFGNGGVQLAAHVDGFPTSILTWSGSPNAWMRVAGWATGRPANAAIVTVGSLRYQTSNRHWMLVDFNSAATTANTFFGYIRNSSGSLFVRDYPDVMELRISGAAVDPTTFTAGDVFTATNTIPAASPHCVAARGMDLSGGSWGEILSLTGQLNPNSGWQLWNELVIYDADKMTQPLAELESEALNYWRNDAPRSA